MTFRIAAATGDGENVNEHFGRACRFDIYEIEERQWRFLEARGNVPACSGQEHDGDLLERTADLLSDCRGVVVAQIGPGGLSTI